MTLLFCDGFDSYSTAADMGNRWLTSSPNWTSNGGKFGGGSYTPAGTSPYISKPLSTFAIGTKLRIGHWFKMTAAAGSGPAPIIISADGTLPNNTLMTMNNIGQMFFWRLGNNATNQIGTTGSSVWGDGQFHWIEIEVLLQTAATGSLTVWIDSIRVINQTNIQTVQAGATLDGITFKSGTSNAGAWFLDDVIVWDDQGTDFNTFPLGPQRITQLKPSGDGTPLQFTPNSGTTHYTQVNGNYSAATYVEDGGTGNVDMYTYPALGYTPTTINAVVGNFWAQNPGTATANLIPKLKTGGTTVSGTTAVLGSGGVNQLVTQYWPKDAQGAAWTLTNLNAMQVGIGD